MSSPRAAAAKASRPPKRAATARQRRPPAPAAGLGAEAARLAAALERSLADGRHDALPPEALQALMAALCKSYSARVEGGERLLPLAGRGAVSPTDVMHTASGLLRGADLQVFELGMWQSWTGR